MSDDWGPWIEHDGKGCPCVGQYMHAVMKHGDEWFGIAGAECYRRGQSPDAPGSAWVHISHYFSTNNWIIRYRIRKPRGMVALERMMAELPVKEGADA